MLRITRALVDTRRFEILQRIASVKDEISCVELRAQISISRATLSHHLRELANAQLIEVRRQSKFMYLRMRTKTWREYLQSLRKIGS